jgi:hypothetical protein
MMPKRFILDQDFGQEGSLGLALADVNTKSEQRPDGRQYAAGRIEVPLRLPSPGG